MRQCKSKGRQLATRNWEQVARSRGDWRLILHGELANLIRNSTRFASETAASVCALLQRKGTRRAAFACPVTAVIYRPPAMDPRHYRLSQYCHYRYLFHCSLALLLPARICCCQTVLQRRHKRLKSRH